MIDLFGFFMDEFRKCIFSIYWLFVDGIYVCIDTDFLGNELKKEIGDFYGI